MFSEQASKVLEAAEGFDLSATPVQGQHELGPAALAQRLGVHGRPQVCDEVLVIAQLKASLEEILLGGRTALHEPHHLGRATGGPFGQVEQRLARQSSSARASSAAAAPG